MLVHLISKGTECVLSVKGLNVCYQGEVDHANTEREKENHLHSHSDCVNLSVLKNFLEGAKETRQDNVIQRKQKEYFWYYFVSNSRQYSRTTLGPQN